jgi:hypothetical protein
MEQSRKRPFGPASLDPTSSTSSYKTFHIAERNIQTTDIQYRFRRCNVYHEPVGVRTASGRSLAGEPHPTSIHSRTSRLDSVVFRIIDYTNSYSKVVYCLVYVIPLYFSTATRPSPTRSRDAPEAIRARILVVSLSTAVCSLVTLYLLSSHGAVAVREPLHFMGYWPLGLVDAARALGLTALLFAGPLYESLVIDGAAHQWLRLEPLRDLWTDWPTWRNLVAVRAI